MGRLQLLDTMNAYRDLWLDPEPHPSQRHASFNADEEHRVLSEFRTFIHSTPDCFLRASLKGHVTGSALVASHDGSQVLLTLHGKLNLWLQLGGHADGNPNIHEVAEREVIEESGLNHLSFLPYEDALPNAPRFLSRLGPVPMPFDFDYHLIPARPNEPSHIHYDVRYLIVADPAEPLVITDESHELRWFALEDARKVTEERSMHRQFDKLEWLAMRLRLDRGQAPAELRVDRSATSLSLGLG